MHTTDLLCENGRRIPILIAMIVGGLVSIYVLKQILPANINWLSYVIVLVGVFFIAPLNQRLEKK